MGSDGLNQARAMIFAAEYHALRAELMFFIQMQRHNMNFLLTTAFGQIIGLAFIGYNKVDPALIIYFYLFAVPSLIGLLMLMSFENTAKIFVVASYISESLRTQIRPLFDKDDSYFLWEYHKKDTNRINRKVLVLLDRSKWLVFIAGLILSMFLAHFVQNTTMAIKNGILFTQPIKISIWRTGPIIVFDQFIIGGILVLLIMFMAFIAARYFSEAEGEAAHNPSIAAIIKSEPQRETAAV